MRRSLILVSTAALTAIGILFLDLRIVGSLPRSSMFNAPWPFMLEGIFLTTLVGYISRSRGWLVGMLTVVATYALIFLILSLIILIGTIDFWRMGGSVLNLIRMNISVSGLFHIIQHVFIKIFLPSLAIGAVGGMIGELFYKQSKARK